MHQINKMKAIVETQNLEEVLIGLQTKKKLSFDEICELLFTFNFEDFDELFQIRGKEIPNETFLTLPIFKGDCVAILTLWGIDHSTAIHDHNNYDGRIKVLRGTLTEVSYRKNSNFIEYDSCNIAKTGEIFPEEFGGIHSIVNNSDDIAVSLHIYRTFQLNLDNVKIFDTEKRKIATLSENAKLCSWHLPANAYQEIIKL